MKTERKTGRKEGMGRSRRIRRRTSLESLRTIESAGGQCTAPIPLPPPVTSISTIRDNGWISILGSEWGESDRRTTERGGGERR